MKQIKILITDYPTRLPESLKEICRRMSEHQDYCDTEESYHFAVEELAAHTNASPKEILLWVKQNKGGPGTQALAVVMSIEPGEQPGLLDHLHNTDPTLTILGVSHDLKTSFIQQLCPHRQQINNLSENRIVNALTQSIRIPCSMGLG